MQMLMETSLIVAPSRRQRQSVQSFLLLDLRSDRRIVVDKTDHCHWSSSHARCDTNGSSRSRSSPALAIRANASSHPSRGILAEPMTFRSSFIWRW